jgi:hypothetical protein
MQRNDRQGFTSSYVRPLWLRPRHVSMNPYSAPLDEQELNNTIEASYVGQLYDASRWYASARALFGASRAVSERAKSLVAPLEQAELGRVYRLLAGMALESLLKALLVQQIPQAEYTTKVPDRLRTHDLRVLTERLKLKLGDAEKDCIRNLTEHVVWVGRYPVPLDAESYSGSACWWDEEEITEGLFRKLSKPFDLMS